MGETLERRILVTGALGQIGMELLDALSSRYGADLIIATDIRDSNKLESSGIKFHKLDVLNKEEIERIIQKFDINEVYHLAALLSASGENNPELCWKINMGGLVNICELSRNYRFRIFAPSSIAVFGSDVIGVANQNSPLNPATMYGITKVSGELLAEYYHATHDVDIRGLRYPGLISWKVMPGGGTTDYAVEIFHAAVSGNRYTCFVDEKTTLPMMYMDDAIRATIELMEAPSENLSVRGGYNLACLSFTAEELFQEIKMIIPEFDCDFEPDHRQRYADSWPDATDGQQAEIDWGFKIHYDLKSMCYTMIQSLRQ